jgi:uncharacterized protein YbaR (Trm112 family)
MPADPTRNLSFDASILDQLACPACLGALRLDELSLVCTECGRTYPIVDGIPVLIADRVSPRARAID